MCAFLVVISTGVDDEGAERKRAAEDTYISFDEMPSEVDQREQQGRKLLRMRMTIGWRI